MRGRDRREVVGGVDNIFWRCEEERKKNEAGYRWEVNNDC